MLRAPLTTLLSVDVAAGPKSLHPACALRSGRAMAVTQRDSATRILLAEEKSPQRNMKTWPLGFGVKLEIVTPFLGKYRPFVGRCCQTCTPKSWQSCFHKHLPSLGFHNVLQVTEEDTRYRGWLVRRLCYFLAVLDWKVHSETPQDLQERIFRSKRVQDVMSLKVPQPRGAGFVVSKSPAQWRSKVLQILGQIQSPLSLFILRLCSWALLRLLNRVFLNLLLHKGQLEMVRRAAQMPDVPLVFLSTRKSQLDGLLLPFLLFSQGLGVPRVTWEYQAYTPSLRALLSWLGGVFLPPGAEHMPDSDRGALSRAILASYIEELLKSQQHLVIFLEEPVSGVSRLSAPGGEWLALVLGAVRAGAVPDVMLVPVGIAYDVAPNASCGGLSGSAQPFGLWSCLLAIRRALGREFGCVRVDFAQPFSLQEYTANSIFRRSCSRKSLEELLLPVILGKSPDLLDWEKWEEWYPGLGAAVELKADERVLVGRLGLHSLSAGVSCSAVMAVAIMSALLLHKHREGVFLSRLMSDFSWLVEEILLRNRDVGFSGRLRDLVLHALSLLQGCISLHRLSRGDVLVAPRETEAAVRELSWHSAALLPVFTCEAVGACAINALLVEMLPFLGPAELPAAVVLSQEELSRKALALLQLLPRDFLLLQPCQSVSCYGQDVLDKLIQCGLLVAEEAPSERLACDTARRRFPRKLLWKEMEDFNDSDSDYDQDAGKRCFKISQLDNCPDFFLFLCGLLGPLLKTFERAAAFLAESGGPERELEYVEKLQRFLVRKAREDGSFECTNRSLAASSVRTFKELGVLRTRPGPAGPILHLSETFSTKGNQEQLEKFIGQFTSS
ncbi:glycerol-3-phosphate acyltransferase 2, mitochondrial isoform X2 [Dermochelys coriacea]|uniref:glycerol-3-phosphate acyltransferase 2, mitochondrial isoform X2 n=1 Tax=Dermochelys coriacea TaxID=27794 RepID=UPI001CA8CA53|nr:glycerol-3-phosphate acyltransferase 2, mitochondrial isoform X2 [Dermochelys coriacea]